MATEWALRRAKGLEENERRKRQRQVSGPLAPEAIRLTPGRALGAIRVTDDLASLAGEYPLDGTTRYTRGYLQLRTVDNSRYLIGVNPA